MEKVIGMALLSAAMVAPAAMAATGDTSTATANWQGVVPGVTPPTGEIIITGKDSSKDIPVGQLMRKPDGSLTGNVIELESHAWTAATSTIGALKDGTWGIEDVRFYVSGVEITGIGWTVFDDAEKLADVAADGTITEVSSGTAINTATSSIKLKVESVVSDANNAKIDEYAGSEGAISVTVMVTEA